MYRSLSTLIIALILAAGSQAQFKRFNLVFDSTQQCSGEQYTITMDGSQVGVEYTFRDQLGQPLDIRQGDGNPMDFTITTSLPQNYSIAATGNTSVGMEFDGYNQYIEAGLDSSFDYSAGFSYECWAKIPTPSANSYHPILFFGHNQVSDVEIYGRTNDLAIIFNRSGSTKSFSYPAPPNDTWYHFAFTYDGTHMNVYYDGVKQTANGSSGGSMTRTQGTTVAFAGIQYSGFPVTLSHQKYAPGMMDDMRLWSDVRTIGEIQTYKSSCVSPTADDLVAYYKIGGDLGNTQVTDATGNNDGSMRSMSFRSRLFTGNSDVPCAQHSTTVMGNAYVDVLWMTDTIFKNDTAMYVGQDADMYQWMDCSTFAPVPGPEGTARMFQPKDTGDYAVIIFAGNCIDTSECHYFAPPASGGGPDPTSIRETTYSGISVFPNPTSGMVSVKSESEIDRVMIFDIRGRFIRTAFETDIDLSDLQPGMYNMRILTQGKTISHRVVVD